MGGYRRFLISALLVLFSSISVFAQNVKPYKIDVSRFPTVNDDKTASFNKATKTFTIKRNSASLALWFDDLNLNDYNIIRIKYKVPTDYGFIFCLHYDNGDSLEWDEYATYCPTYLTEMVIPLLSKSNSIHGIEIASLWNVDYQQVVLDSVTLEKVSNPQRTDVYASDEPPVIDASTAITINGKTDAWDFVQELGAGINYQAFECPPHVLDFGMDFQPRNGHSKPTKEQIRFIKQKGFKTIRIQTNPNLGAMLDKNYTINPQFFKALRQVVDWCIEEDMYVIVCGPFAEYMDNDEYKRRIAAKDIHYAGYYVSEKNKKESRKFIESVWKQYAQAFNNSYDEHLIFETFNEPVDMLHEHNFWERTDCATCKKDFAILNEYNQLIVDTIRSTGGNNANRFILIEGLGARWQNISNNLFKMPKDKAKNKLIPTFHYYPMGGSEEYSNKYYIDAIKDQIPEAFAALDKKYFSKHIPVYLGETGQSRHTPIMERINMMKDIMAEVTKPGRSCNASLWNDSDFSGISPWFSGYFDNWKLKWYDEEFVNTFLYGAQGKEYPLSADFIKRNEVKIESLVGKNILSEPLDLTDFGEDYRLAINLFYHSTPAKYKLVFDVEKKSSDSILRLAYQDLDSNWHEIAPMKGVKIKGGTLKDGWCISVKDNTVELSIDETLASELSGYAQYIFLNGKNIIIKSVKVVE